MTREEIYQRCEREIDRTKGVLLESGTGTGKTKIAINLINHLVEKDDIKTVLLLVAKKVHKQTWNSEFKKWGLNDSVHVVTECYESLKKHKDKSYDVIVLDECHHIQSDLRIQLLSKVSFNYMLGLSATIPKNLKKYLTDTYCLGVVRCSLQDAIEDGVLPEPEIMLLPLQLDNKVKCEMLEINPKKPGAVQHDDYEHLWKYKRKHHAFLKCTKKQKLQYMDMQILYAKRLYMSTRSAGLERRWLRMCGDRLKYLAECKNDLVKQLLEKLSDKRVLTFCSSIEQTEVLGKNCIHSKNKMANEVLNDFNEERINHITACQVLNEGVNLKSCQYGVFANINASDIIKVQRVGRILRHEHPVVIIPYYENTREEEIVKEWVDAYDMKLVHKYNSLTDLTDAIINR